MKLNIFPFSLRLRNYLKTLTGSEIKSAAVLKIFDRKLVYNEKHLKITTKYYESKVSKNFHDNGMSHRKFLNAYISNIDMFFFLTG